MNLKNELKMGMLHEQGVKADDRLEGAVKRQAAHDGAKQALRLIAKNIAGLAPLVDKDLDEGKLPLEEPLKVASYVKLMLDRAAQMALSAGQHQEQLQISVGGEITAYQGMVDSLKKEILAEQAKAEALRQAVAAGEVVVEGDASASQQDGANPRDRPTGARPGLGIAAQRRAEEAAEPKASGKRGAKKKS